MNPDEMQAVPVYEQLTKIVHNAARQGKTDLLTRDNLDALARHLSQGQFESYDQVIDAQNRRNRLISQQEMEQAADPGALATFAGKGFESATFGLGPKMLGMVSPELQQSFGEGLQRGGDLHPGAELGGDITGILAGGFGLGRAAGSIPGLRALPNSMSAGIQGAAAGATGGYASGLGMQPGQEWNFQKPLLPAALGGALGFGMGAGAEKLLSSVNAAADRAHELIRRSAPVGTGIGAGTGFWSGVRELEKLNSRFNGILRRPLALLTRRLEQSLQQTARVSPTMADDATTTLTRMERTVDAAYQKLARDPVRGYPILEKVDLSQNPQAAAIAREQGFTGQVTARWLENLRQELRNEVRTLKLQKESGMEKVRNATLQSRGEKLSQIEKVLDDVPGYSELRARVAPYLNYLQQIRKLRSRIERSRLRPTPLVGGGGGLAAKDAVKAAVGLDRGMAQERTARSLGQALLQHDNPLAMMSGLSDDPLFGFLRSPEAVAGATGTAAGSSLWRRLQSPYDEE